MPRLRYPIARGRAARTLPRLFVCASVGAGRRRNPEGTATGEFPTWTSKSPRLPGVSYYYRISYTGDGTGITLTRVALAGPSLITNSGVVTNGLLTGFGVNNAGGGAFRVVDYPNRNADLRIGSSRDSIRNGPIQRSALRGFGKFDAANRP